MATEPTNTFVAGEDILASEVNTNFEEIWNDKFQTYTLGENITAPAPVYVKESDGKIYKTSAAANDQLLFRYVGILAETGVTDDVKKVRVDGIAGGFSFGVATETISEATEISLTAGSTDLPQYDSTAYAKQSFFTGLVQENISSFKVYLKRAGTPNNLLTVGIYEVGTDGQTTGAALVTKTFASADLTTSYVAYEVLTSAIDVKPRQKYIVTITNNSSNLSNPTIGWFVQIRDTAATYTNGEKHSKLSGGNDTMFTDGSAINFECKYTKQRNYYVTDDIFLDDTAGTLSLNPDTKIKKAGEILSSSTILVTDKHKSQYIYKVGITQYGSNNFTTGELYFPIPRNTKRVLITGTGLGETKVTTEIVFSDYVTPQIVIGLVVHDCFVAIHKIDFK